MQEHTIHTKSCNRREFVLASGVFVVGSMVSCGKQHAPELPKTRIKPSPVRVRIGKSVNRVVIGNNAFTIKNVGNLPKTVDIQPKTAVVIAGNTKQITGTIVLHPRENRSLDVVAHVPLEQYLPGVIAGELFSHWHLDTFAAQAVAARSYAIAQQLARKRTSHYDVTDGPSSQMFLGDVTLDVAHRAVQKTTGVVLTWNNEIIPAYYSACCGGLAATATDAISGAEQHDMLPLHGHEGKDFCTTLAIHKWTARRSARVLRKRLNACANKLNLPELTNIHTIRSIEPLAHNQHGRPTQISVSGRRGETCTVSARDFVRAVNAPIDSLPKVTDQIWSSFLVGQKVGSRLQLDGFGIGHGVGLCQYGAQVLAGRGESWQNILSWYYPSVTMGV
jgi:stage II sporulation protein D|tara:strand:+ start:749 stop:1918 length:1170 start_codon:yes stop_codon:yes gene_type:complete